MHIDDGREPIDGHLPEGRVADDSGVVDHDVHSPQASRAESMIACPPSGLVTLWGRRRPGHPPADFVRDGVMEPCPALIMGGATS